MKHMNRWIGLLVAFALLALPTLCLAETAGTLTPGVYQATAQGNNGDVTVEVEVSDSAIIRVDVIDHQETPGTSDGAIQQLPLDIVENQSIGVDAASGATNSSNAILTAVADAIRQAGGNPTDWNVAVEKQAGEDEELTADVVVIGGGASGLAAAVAAAQDGAEVILVEKASSIGGTTAISGGSFATIDPAIQDTMEMSEAYRAKLHGYLDLSENEVGPFTAELATLKEQITAYEESGSTTLFDSAELHAVQHYLDTVKTDLYGNTVEPDYALTMKYVTYGLDTLNWLKDSGVEYNDTVMAAGTDWQRTHSAVGRGGGLTTALKDILEQNGATVLLNTAATSLIYEDGAVKGINAEKSDGTKVTIRAKGGVVIATGGFSSNPEMLNKYQTQYANMPEDIGSSNPPAMTGDGITMAQDIGANVVGMGFVQTFTVAANGEGGMPEFGFQLYVNKEGNRFADEGSGLDPFASHLVAMNDAAMAQPGGIVYAVGDAFYYNFKGEEAFKGYEEKGYGFVADTLEELAEKAGIDPEAFVASVEKYNQYVDDGVDPDFGTTAFNSKVETAPFCMTAIKIVAHNTMGGLEINTDAQVLNTDGEAIPGLYAAGEVTGGIEAGYRSSGDCIGICLTYGRIAGDNAAANK